MAVSEGEDVAAADRPQARADAAAGDLERLLERLGPALVRGVLEEIVDGLGGRVRAPDLDGGHGERAGGDGGGEGVGTPGGVWRWGASGAGYR